MVYLQDFVDYFLTLYYTNWVKGDENVRKKQILMQLKASIEKVAELNSKIEKLNNEISKKETAIKTLNEKVFELEKENNKENIDSLNKIIEAQLFRINELEELLKEQQISEEIKEDTDVEIILNNESKIPNSVVGNIKEKIGVVSKEIGKLTVSVLEVCAKIKNSGKDDVANDVQNKFEAFKKESLKIINKYATVQEIQDEICKKCDNFIISIKKL